MDQKNNKYAYYAFISYKREDEKWAKWLHKRLESYGFPVTLRKENPSLPSKIRPVFRDQSELSGGNLKEEIEKGLANSKYLIVICSPRAAKSPWVSKEVQYFIANGRENFIIPFIIGGTPNAANPEEECFPEGLRQLFGEREILGININEMGRDAAAIKVIARMFDLRFDTLWQRHERAKRRRRFAVITAVALFALISFGIGAYMTYLNTQISAQRDRAEKQTKIANSERERANKERDNAIALNKSLKQAKDSIQFQSDLIAQTNRNLEQANRDLAEERDNVINANRIMFNLRMQKGILDSHKSVLLAADYIRKGNANKGLDLIKSKLTEHPELYPIFEQQLRDSYDTLYYSSYPYAIFAKLPESVSNIDYDNINDKIWAVDGSILKIWDKETQKVTASFKQPEDLADMYNCHYNPLLNLYATSEVRGNTLSLFKVDSNYRLSRLETKVGYDSAFSPDYKYLWECVNLGQENAVINLIDLEINKTIKSFKGLINGWSKDKNSFIYSVGEWGEPIKYYYYDTKTNEDRYLGAINDFVDISFTNNAENIWYEESDGLGCVYLRNTDNCPSSSSLLNCLVYGNGIIENIKPGHIMIYENEFKIPVYLGEKRVITYAMTIDNEKILLGCDTGEIILINNPVNLKKRYRCDKKNWEEHWCNPHRDIDLFKEIENFNNNEKKGGVNIACKSNDGSIIIYSDEEGNINLITTDKNDRQNNILSNQRVYDLAISPDNSYFAVLEGDKFTVYRMLDFVEVYRYSLDEMLGHYLEFELAENGYNIKIYSSHYEGPEDVPWNSMYVPTILENIKQYIIDFPFYSLDYILNSFKMPLR